MFNTECTHLWQEHIKATFLVPAETFLQLNIVTRRIASFLIPEHTWPPFWTDILTLWFRTKYVPRNAAISRPGDALQTLVYFNSVSIFKMSYASEIYSELCALNIHTVEQFLRHKDTHPDNAGVRWLIRHLPTQWLLMDKNADLSQTLAMGVIQKKCPPREVYSFLRDAKYKPLNAINSWSRELLDPVSQKFWNKASLLATHISDVRLRSFHLFFLNRGYYTNVIMSKFTDITDQCSFCGQERRTLISTGLAL